MSSSFEKNLSRLEEIVTLLESEDCPLEDAMSLFEEGIGLSNKCNTTLESAKLKLTQLAEKENGDNNDC